MGATGYSGPGIVIAKTFTLSLLPANGLFTRMGDYEGGAHLEILPLNRFPPGFISEPHLRSTFTPIAYQNLQSGNLFRAN